MSSLLGTKRGMTQIWREDGTRVPVTVIDVPTNQVCGLRTEDKHGYEAVQIGMGDVRVKLLTKPLLGQFTSAELEPRRHLREVRMPVGESKLGDQIDAVDLFEVGSAIDVVGTSKGKGFAGTIKLHGFARGPTSHGSQNVRRPGSIGMCKYPGRVIRGKKMASRMGAERVTVKGLEVIAVDADRHQVLVKGPVPGNVGGLVMLRRRGAVEAYPVKADAPGKSDNDNDDGGEG